VKIKKKLKPNLYQVQKKKDGKQGKQGKQEQEQETTTTDQDKEKDGSKKAGWFSSIWGGTS